MRTKTGATLAPSRGQLISSLPSLLHLVTHPLQSAKTLFICDRCARPERSAKIPTRSGLALLTRSPLDGDVLALAVAGVDLARARDLLLLIEQHLFPLRQPTDGARDGEQHREHVEREA